ncbi:MAG: hypothetical protein DRP37_04425 [Thermodesulfobacteriota bacterium]|nr:MAG: hypothetical protein DRP37_04425 [Thermodesulfobacteriota bacterium]
MNELDQFVKHRLKCRYYLRYCDDFVMLPEERGRLVEWKSEIERFLAGRLRLRLNRKRQSFQPVSNGINFLGYITLLDPKLPNVAGNVIVNHVILRRFLPGPYTFILPGSREVPKMMLTKRRTVGIRIPY